MNILDAFFVEIGLDTTKFDAGRKQAESDLEQAGRKVGADATAVETLVSKSFSEAFKNVERRVLAFFGILLGARGVQDFVANVTKAETSLGIFSAALGVTPKDLSAFEMAVERVGGSTEGAASSLATFNKMVVGFNLEMKQAPEWFGRIGGYSIDPKADRLSQFLQLSRLMQKFRGSENQKFYILSQLGIDQGTARFLLQGPDAVQAQLKSAGADATTAGQVASGTRLNAAWQGAAQALQSLGRNILDAVSGPLTTLLDNLAKFVTENKAWLSGWPAAATGAVAAVATIAGASSLIGLATATIEAAAAITVATAGLAAVLAAFEAMSGGIPAAKAAEAAPAPNAARPVASQPVSDYKPAWIDPGKPGDVIGKREGMALETSEGPVSEGRPLPVKVSGASDGDGDDDTVWGIIQHIGRLIKRLIAKGGVFLTNMLAPYTHLLSGGGAVGGGGGSNRREWAGAARGVHGGKGPNAGMTGAPATAAEVQAAMDQAKATGKYPNTIAGREAFIRMTAPRYGIDPDFAVDVAKSEGMFSTRKSQGSYVDVDANGNPYSFWDFQLNYRRGVGVFAGKAGIDPANPDDWMKADDFALRWMSTHGMGDWRTDAAFRKYGGQVKRVPIPSTVPAIPKPAADAAASEARQSMLMINRHFDVPAITVNAASAHGHGVAQEIRMALQRELSERLAVG